MPIFEFKCSNCGKIFEGFFRLNDSIDAISCPICQSNDIKKICSPFGVNTRASYKGEYTPESTCDELSCIPGRQTPFDGPHPSHTPEEDSFSAEEFDEDLE